MRDILHIYSEINISTILTNQSKGANLCFFKKKKREKRRKNWWKIPRKKYEENYNKRKFKKKKIDLKKKYF